MNTRHIFVGNYPSTFTHNDIRSLFRHISSVIEVNQLEDRYSHVPRGFSIVSFATTQLAKQACDTVHGTVVKEKRIVVNPAYLPNNPRT